MKHDLRQLRENIDKFRNNLYFGKYDNVLRIMTVATFVGLLAYGIKCLF